MGVDYGGVGGVGIRITKDMFDKVRKYLIFADRGQTEDNKDVEEWCECDLLEALGLSYSEAGDGNYGGDARFYWLVKGKTLTDVLTNMREYLNTLNGIGIGIDEDDLEIIKDIHVW